MTNQIAKVGLIIGFALSTMIESAAQQLSEGEFEAIVADGKRILEKKLREKPHRITTTVTAGRASSKLFWVSIKDVFERGSDGEVRIRREEGAAGNGRIVEIVIMNGICFKRTGREQWRRHPMTAVGPMLRPSMGLENDNFAKRLISSKWSLLRAGVRKFNGEYHNTFTSTLTEDYIYEINGNDVRSETVDMYLVRPDGMLVKYERSATVTSQANGAATVYRFAVEWETDSAFIIEAPDLGR